MPITACTANYCMRFYKWQAITPDWLCLDCIDTKDNANREYRFFLFAFRLVAALQIAYSLEDAGNRLKNYL